MNDTIKLSKIIASEEFNCRGQINNLDVADLISNIDRQGLQMPVLVTELNQEYIAECKALGVQIPSDAEYFLIAGFRRFKAFQILAAGDPAKWSEIPAIIREISPRNASLMNLTENLVRKDLTVVQEAHGLKRMYENGYTEAEAATALGKTRGWIQIRFMILRLPKELYGDINSGNITQPDVRTIYSLWKTKRDDNCSYLESCNAVFELVRKIKEKNMSKSSSRKPTRAEKLKSKTQRAQRETLEMQKFIYTQMDGPNEHTDALAWTAGEISTGEFLNRLERDLGVDINKFYTDI